MLIFGGVYNLGLIADLQLDNVAVGWCWWVFFGCDNYLSPQKNYLFVEFVLVQLQVETTSNYYTKLIWLLPQKQT